jgi:uncharacterized membrane protein (Fun14 family)
MAFEFETALALIFPFVIGLLVGYILKHAIKILGAIIVLVLLLLLFGYINVGMLEFFFKNLLNYGEKALEAAKTVSNVLPASSLIFLLGVAVGYFLSK